jgi:hypothetical protein
MNALFEDHTLPDGRAIRVAKARPEVRVIPIPPEVRTKARDGALIYAENRLSAWAKWAKEHRESLGYPTISTLFRAMQVTKVGIMRGSAEPEADEHGQIHYPINADGHATRSMRPPSVGEIPEAIGEVDHIVAVLPRDLRLVLVADYFTYGAIEERCKRTRWRRARYSQLLEAAKYAVYVALRA